MDGDLLDHIEKSSDSVDTTQLLDLLERETHQTGPLSASVVRPSNNSGNASRVPPSAVNNGAAIDDDMLAVKEEKQQPPMMMSDGGGRSKQQQTPRRRPRTNRSGYNSGDSHDSSFTSPLLGGKALL